MFLLIRLKKLEDNFCKVMLIFNILCDPKREEEKSTEIKPIKLG